MSDVEERIATENGQSKIENALLKIVKAIEDINEDKPKEKAEITKVTEGTTNKLILSISVYESEV